MTWFFEDATKEAHNKAVAEKRAELGNLTENLKNFLKDNRVPGFCGDNLIAIGRNMGFTKNARFLQSIKGSMRETEDMKKLWRLHIYSWACRTALTVPGDMVECGVYRGLYVDSAIRFLGPDSFADRQFYLYDSFAGLDPKYSSEIEMERVLGTFSRLGLEEEVRERFSDYDWVKVIKGIVPEILHKEAPDTIAFLHLDLNAGKAEIKALDVLFDRVAEGGVILLDDYGRYEFEELFHAHNAWFINHGQNILEQPTGQGLIIKKTNPSKINS